MTRCSECGAEKRREVGESRAAFEAVKGRLRSRREERLVVLLLDAQNQVIGRPITVSVGSLNTTHTHPREILRPAIEKGAAGFVLAHNHPSGSLVPSQNDIDFTRAIARAGEIMGIALYDHLIVAQGRYVSLREKGLL